MARLGVRIPGRPAGDEEGTNMVLSGSQGQAQIVGNGGTSGSEVEGLSMPSGTFQWEDGLNYSGEFLLGDVADRSR
jgi:hypothetical protein